MATFEAGQQLFEAGKYAEAKETFSSALMAPDADAKKLKMWIRKCDTHLSEPHEETVPQPQPQGGATAAAGASAAPPSAQPTPGAPAAEKAPPKAPSLVRHEWFQSPSSITLSFFVKNRKPEDVSVHVEPRTFEVTIKLDEGKEFQVSFDPLFADVDPKSIRTEVRAMKVEVTLGKVSPIQWPALEGTAGPIVGAATVPAALPNSQKELPSAYSRQKKFVVNDEDIKDVDGGDPTTNFFKQIFGNGSDEQRRAMMKSFQQSGGTVLSTNWEDIGSRDVKCEAPKGMEVRKWEQ